MSFIYYTIIFAVGVHADVVEISDGRVEGTTSVARNGRIFNAYYGIPYAKPPIGNLRFQPPVPAEKWEGVFKATGAPVLCPQILENENSDFAGTEDCLYVNVFSPQKTKSGFNLPVIFYIFGGIFKMGYPLKFGPEYILSRDVILVQVSYRLGALGFLSTGDTIISGNMGLKDQTLAMKWTHENIFAFGWDPNRVILHGHSSGAICAHLHTLSPLSQGYFQRVIMQSGTAIMRPSAVFSKVIARSMSTTFAHKVNCSSKSSVELLQCLLSRDAEYLVRMTETIEIWSVGYAVHFSPTIEDPNAENVFLTNYPVRASYPSTKLPWLIGITTGEAAYYVSGFFADSQKLQEIATTSPKLSLPILTEMLYSPKPAHLDFTIRAIKTHFFGDDEISPATDDAFVDLLTGSGFGMGILHTLQKYEGLKYAYLYDYRGNWTSQDTSYGKFLGVAHSDELPLIYKQEGTTFTEEDYIFGDEIITRWINFAYSGNPNEPFPINTSFFGAWNPVTSPNLEYLRIKKHGSMEANYFREKYEFWLKLPIFSGLQ